MGRGGEAAAGVALSLLVNWKLCSRARNLPEIPIDRGILQRGGGGGGGVQGQGRQASGCPDRWLPSFHTAGGQGPQWPEAVRAKL